MTIGRIGGPMLKENLVRQGVDLSVETNLLYFDVNNMRVGINTATPNVAMDINGITRFSSNLQINGSNIATYAGNGNITLTPNGTGKVNIAYLTANRIPYASTGGSLVDNSALTFDGVQLVTTTASVTTMKAGNIQISTDTITSLLTNGNIVLNPSGTGNVLLDTATANTIVYAGTNTELLTSSNLTFNGTNLVLSGTANITTLNVSTISSPTTNGNITLDPNGTGNVLLDTATANTIVYAGTNKELLTSSSLTFNGTTMQIGNISATSNTIGSANTNGNINLDPNGTGRVIVVGTNAMTLPNGDTSQRPTGVAGDFRFNSELDALEFYNGTSWQTVQSAGGSFQFSESFNGDGGTTVFTLTYATTSSGAFVTLNGVMQSPGVAYSVSGTTLTFTEAPASGDRIDVRYIGDADTLVVTSLVNGTSNVNVISSGNVTISSAGNANVLTVTGSSVISSGTIQATQLISNIATGTAPFTVTSTTQVANLNVATAGSATTAGTVTTASQPNITSVGTLSTLTVTGNINTSASLNDAIGNVRSIPQNPQTALYTLAASDNGKHISSNSNVTVPNTIFSTGNTINVYNNSAANITILQGTGVTMYLAGSATTGNRTLAQRGLASILCVAANTFVITGSGIT